MNLKITSYLHGKDLNNILYINLIFLLDAKTIGTVEFRNNNCSITIYDNDKNKRKELLNLVIANGLFQIFGRYLNFELNKFGECEITDKNLIEKVIKFIKEKNIECNFLELNKESFLLNDVVEEKKSYGGKRY